ncbi:hypothetical protein OIV83_001966 [Microbotryomycetes sp. JL201]|nr:hypothetical protein OIV83_001966 [Microbotryomycetes sp. JL201]
MPSAAVPIASGTRDAQTQGSPSTAAQPSSSLPSTARTDDGAHGSSDPSSTRTSFTAAVTRALFGTLAFLFKRPIRLFRPVKISTMTGIQAIAEEQGRSVTPAFVRALIRKEGWSFLPRHVLPPLFVNCAIGLTLFTSYSSAESFLTKHLGSTTLVPFLSGSFAGSIQSILSAPLDNARLLLLRRQRLISRYGHRKAARVQGAFTGWPSLIKMALFHNGSGALGANVDGASSQVTTTRSGRIAQARQWARRGWSLFSLSMAKDALSFGIFFTVFEAGRECARRAGLMMDGLPVTAYHAGADWSNEDDEYSAEFDGGTRISRRSTLSLVVQSFLILVTGGMAGVAFAVVARPFERCRGAIWEGRARWAEHDGRLRVIEELALQDAPTSARQTPEEKRRRQSKVGSARRHAVRIQTVRRRGTGRTFVRAARRQLKSRVLSKHQAAIRKKAANVNVIEPVVRTPIPSATSLVRNAVRVHGARTFFFATSLPRTDHRRQTTVTGGTPQGIKTITNRGPTRLSARNRLPQHSFLKSSGYRVARVLAYIPPYAVGFFAFALMSGDLR